MAGHATAFAMVVPTIVQSWMNDAVTKDMTACGHMWIKPTTNSRTYHMYDSTLQLVVCCILWHAADMLPHGKKRQRERCRSSEYLPKPYYRCLCMQQNLCATHSRQTNPLSLATIQQPWLLRQVTPGTVRQLYSATLHYKVTAEANCCKGSADTCRERKHVMCCNIQNTLASRLPA